MARVSVCIEMIFTEVDLYERPAKVAEAGLGAIEFWGTTGKDIGRLKAACDEAGVAVAGFIGLASGKPLVERQLAKDLRHTMRQGAKTAKTLGVTTFIVTVGNVLAGVPARRQVSNIVRALKAVAPVAEDKGISLAVEPLNTLVDHVGYFLDRTAPGREIVERVDSPAVGLLYDVYHMQIMEGNLIETIRRNADILKHVHIADVPGRMEPGTGEINYANVLKAIDQVGYRGYCGFEFRPSDNSAAALMRAKAACGLP